MKLMQGNSFKGFFVLFIILYILHKNIDFKHTVG